MDALVGTDIDRKVAVRLGLKLAHVQRRRVELGRPPFGAITEAKIQRVLKMRRARTKLKQIVAKTGVSLTSVERILQRASQAKENDLGYGTPKHQEGLAKLGPCPIHRTQYKPIRDALEAMGGIEGLRKVREEREADFDVMMRILDDHDDD